MKEIFDFKRFGKYFVFDLRSCAANYGYSLTLICLMGVIIYIGTVSMGLLFNGTWGGPTEAFRNSVFCFSMFVLAVTMPVKCYGRLTEKRAGSEWLMIPASKLEKYLSMVLITVAAVPVSGLVYCGLDAVLCALDPTCGSSIISLLLQPGNSDILMAPTWQNLNSGISLSLSFLLCLRAIPFSIRHVRKLPWLSRQSDRLLTDRSLVRSQAEAPFLLFSLPTLYEI